MTAHALRTWQRHLYEDHGWHLAWVLGLTDRDARRWHEGRYPNCGGHDA